MHTLRHDLRYGLRLLARSPGFTLVAVASLAIGIGANTTIFSLMNALLFRPLPVDRPEELVAVFTSDYSGPLYGASSYPDYQVFRDESQVFSGLVAYTVAPIGIEAGLHTERAFAQLVSGNFFAVLGVEPALGRAFGPDEDRSPGTGAVAVISHGLWMRRFAGDPGVLGKTTRLAGRPFTVVGVAPPSFTGLPRGLDVDLWVPIHMQPVVEPGRNDLVERGTRGLFLMGRLRAGVTLAAAQSHFDVLAAELHRAHPEYWTNVRSEPRRVTLVAESEARVPPEARGAVTGFMSLLMATVGLVLLISCANVAGMLMARATARRREIAIRRSLGAGRARLLRQLLTESILLSLGAGAIGVLLALWGTHAITSFTPPLPVPIALDLHVDGPVLGFTLVVSLVAGLLFGLAPSLEASGRDLASSLKDGAGVSPRQQRLRSGLVVAEVGLSVLLLIGSGLFVRSLQNAMTTDPGFDAENLLLVSLDLSLSGHGEESGRAFYRELLSRLRSLRGVAGASFVEWPPLSLGSARRGITVEGYSPGPGEDMEVHSTLVGPGYFETMRIAVLRGRGFTDADRERTAGVALVNQAFASRYWPTQDPLGKHIRLGSRANAGAPDFQVVGIVRDGKYVSLGEEPRPFFYLPLLQRHEPQATLIVRTASDPAASLPLVRNEIGSLDPSVATFDARTMTEHLALSLLPARLAGAVLGGFGAVALLLAGLGVYGVVAYWVAQRAREIALRMALGAQPADVLRLVVRLGMTLALAGIAIGLTAAVALTRLLSGFLYGVSPTDLATFSGIPALLAFGALLASYLPARRAVRIDALVALRCE